MRNAFLILLVCWMNAFAGSFVIGIKPGTLDPALAKAVIEDVKANMLIYYQDRGVYPGSIEQLVEANYIPAIDSATLSQWKFEIEHDQYPASIKAEPNVLSEGDPEAMTKIFFGYFGENTLTYEVSTGHWKGFGVYDFEQYPPTAEQKVELTHDVCKAIEGIAFATNSFYNDRGVYPRNIRELMETRYILLTPAVYVQWDLQLLGNPPYEIEAISSHLMPDGQGKVLTYNIQNEQFTGYGMEE